MCKNSYLDLVLTFREVLYESPNINDYEDIVIIKNIVFNLECYLELKED